MDKRGEFIVAEIIEVNAGAYSAQNVTFKYIDNNRIELGYQQYSLLFDGFDPKIGQKYLGKYMEDKYGTNYIFLNIPLPDNISIHQPVVEDFFIGKDTTVSFMRL